MLIQTDTVNVRHIVDDVTQSVGFYTRHLAFSVISNGSGSSISDRTLTRQAAVCWMEDANDYARNRPHRPDRAQPG
jgi:hypothetical protein